MIGNPLETTIALSHLIFEGTLDRFPGLKICAAHGGGYLPSYARRSDHGCLTFPDRCTGGAAQEEADRVPASSSTSTRSSSRPRRCATSRRRSARRQLVMGTDYPFPWTKTSVDHILDTPGFTDAERIAMLGGTAAKLLKINGV